MSIVKIAPKKRMHWLEKLRFNLIRNQLKAISPTNALKFKESIEYTDKLDYDKQDIEMFIDTPALLGRLQACRKEPETVQWIEQYIQPGDTFYDIGANVGAYSFVVDAHSKGACTIYSFEPSFSTFAVLCRNIFLNHTQDRMTPFQIGLSNKTGLLSFHYSKMNAGASMHALGEAIDEENGEAFTPAYSQSILSLRLDDLIEQFNLKMPNHIKIDVDRAIYPVLQGAVQTLKHPGVKSLLIELNQFSETYNDSLALLAASGLTLISKVMRPNQDHWGNHIFIKQ